jgi:hypothetical protein
VKHLLSCGIPASCPGLAHCFIDVRHLSLTAGPPHGDSVCSSTLPALPSLTQFQLFHLSRLLFLISRSDLNHHRAEDLSLCLVKVLILELYFVLLQLLSPDYPYSRVKHTPVDFGDSMYEYSFQRFPTPVTLGSVEVVYPLKQSIWISQVHSRLPWETWHREKSQTI